MTRYTRALRHRDFRYLFYGQTVSVIGDRLVVVALALYVTDRTGSPSDLGIVLTAQALPLIGLVLFGGVFADRLPKQRLIVASDAVRCALHALLAVLILTGGAAVWQMAVIEAGYGAALAFFQPAFAGLVPETVPEQEIPQAKALTQWINNLAYLVGPAIGTALVLAVGAGEAFALDAASFLISAVTALAIRPRSRAAEPASPSEGSVLHELAAGWREVRSRTWVWTIISVFCVAVLTSFAGWYALAPSVARDHYHDVGLFGVLEALAGGGAVIGAVAAMRWQPRRPLFVGMVIVLAWPLQGGLLALGAPAALVGAASLACGFGFAVFTIWWETALAQHVPPAALGRVSAWDWMGSLALLPVGYAAAGPLAGAIGGRTALGAGSLVAFVALLVGCLPRAVREVRLASASAEEGPGEMHIAVGGEPQVPHVDAFI